jgi:hypothetical protein
MKNAHFIFVLILVLGMASCAGDNKGNENAQNPDSTGQKSQNGKAPIDPNAGQQIPAKEILGSNMERHLRYQPEAEVAQYIDKLSDLDAYLFNVSGAIRRRIGNLTPGTPNYGTVVVGVNAKGEQRVWYVFPAAEPTDELKAAIHAALADVPKLKVNKELVVVGFALTLWGYQETHEQAGRILLPKEWDEANKRFPTPQKATKLAQLTWDNADV